MIIVDDSFETDDSSSCDCESESYDRDDCECVGDGVRPSAPVLQAILHIYFQKAMLLRLPLYTILIFYFNGRILVFIIISFLKFYLLDQRNGRGFGRIGFPTFKVGDKQTLNAEFS